MKVVFISDLHLSEEKPELVRSFLYFLEHQARSAHSLYILGDLFDLWVGDDCMQPWHFEIARALKQYSRQHGLYFIKGNRDFLIGKQFCDLAGFTLLSDCTVITVDQIKILLLHGDTLCTKDRSYQLYRHFVHSKIVRFIYSKLSKKIKLKIANKIRQISGKSQQNYYNNKYNAQTVSIKDAQPEAIVKTMQQFNVKYMIHGHTHRPGEWTHQIMLKDNVSADATRIVLGDWRDTSWWVLEYTDGVFKQESHPVIKL